MTNNKMRFAQFFYGSLKIDKRFRPDCERSGAMLSQHGWENDFGINHLGRDVVVCESVRLLHRGAPKNLRTKSRSRGDEHKSSTHAPPFLPRPHTPANDFMRFLSFYTRPEPEERQF